MKTASIILLVSLALAATDPDPSYTPSLDDDKDKVSIEATLAAWKHAAEALQRADDSKPKDKYARADEVTCLDLAGTNYLKDIATAPGACDNGKTGFVTDPDCDDLWLAPLWVQRLRNNGTYDQPEKIDDGQCITPADIAAQARREFRTMKIPTPKATLQGNPPMVVNVHYPAYTSAAPQERQVELLTVPVVIRADPAEFTWDFDDPYSTGGTTLTTTDPGRPWHTGDPLPDTTWVGHTYTRLGTPGTDPGTLEDEHGNAYRTDVTVSLTTTWQGRFRVQGSSTWTTIPDTLTTTSTTTPTTVTEARTRLVCDDLDGHSTC